jgi:hypothetical protein
MSYNEEDYKDVVGRKVFRGVAEADEGTYFKLDDKVYFLYHDPDDGYRSHGFLQGEAKPESYAALMFNLEHKPLEVDVVFCDSKQMDKWEDFTGLEIYGAKDICGVRIEPLCVLGTGNCNDYYPYYLSQFNSKEATEVSRLQDEYIAELILLDKEHRLLLDGESSDN